MPELYIKIPVSFQNKINEILKPINNLSFKGSQVIDILNEQTSSYNQLYFQAVHEFIKHVEHEDKYSYYDKTAKVMSIGIGFNLEQPGADKIMLPP